MVQPQSSSQRHLAAGKKYPAGSISLAQETAPRKLSDYRFVIGATAIFIVCAHWVFSNYFQSNDSADLPGESLHANLFNSASGTSVQEQSSVGLLQLVADSLNTQWSNLPDNNNSEDLLLQASQAVTDQDHVLLANTMRLIGMNALQSQDIDSAEVYFNEALQVFEELEDELGIASVELLRGELSINRRAQARRAAYAYDAMQLARWKVAHGRFHEAVEALNNVVNENLALNRFGAAAAAYQTLYNGYVQHGQLYEAQEAGIEIVKLHASSGRALRAAAMIETLTANGLDQQTRIQLQHSNAALQQEYEKSVLQLGQARDYQQLFNHFIHAGDPVRAWQFRLKSQQSLRGVSARAMHRAQSGVMALLYSSNDHMKEARHSLDRAGRLFSNNNESELSKVSVQMQSKVF